MSQTGQNQDRSVIIQHWLHWLLNLLAVVVVGFFAIPFVRTQPESVHSFALSLATWQQVILTFLLCVVFTHFLFKLFSPRWSHLRYTHIHPPTWLAWFFGISILGVVDLAIGLSPDRYQAEAWEWGLYGLGPVILVSIYRWLSSSQESASPSTPQPERQLSTAKWEDIEAWLRSDAPADLDFLGTHAMPQRIKSLLEAGTQSVGIVGPFGAGKTSVIKWLIDLVNADRTTRPRLLISEHSCWKFESSSLAIRAMLADAIAKVEGLVDTFYVSSLPESYRQTFSSGDEWLESVSKLIFGQRDPIEQFSRLSALLGNMEIRLVFIVEDLDRNDSRTFDIQEIQAFLQQLKEFPNLSFVLTGGLASSSRIDFAKLCDHIEYTKSIDSRLAAELVQRVSQRCLDPQTFCYEAIAEPDRQYVWNALTGMMMRDYEEMSLPQAVATLLNTPRSLRHALGRTYTAWQNLYGEIDWNHLFAVNVLRFAAPEAFLFLLRRWDRLRDQPTGDRNGPQIRQAILNDWNQTIQNVEWDVTAARTVMAFLLPPSESWLVDGSRSTIPSNSPQGIQHERYWRRAVNEAIEPGDVRDQTIIRDLRAWLASPSVDSQLVTQLCTSEPYSNHWEELAGHVMQGQPDQILLLCEQVLARICSLHGAAASSDSQGFCATWRFANRRVGIRPDNRPWLERQIEAAAGTSTELVNSLWHYYGAPSQQSILLRSDAPVVRQRMIEILRDQLTEAEALESLIHPTYPYTLYQLVFDPGDHNRNAEGDISAWGWLAPIVVASLRRGNILVACGVASLISSRTSGSRTDPVAVDQTVLATFFGQDAEVVITLLTQLASQITDPEQNRLVTSIANSGREILASNAPPNSGSE